MSNMFSVSNGRKQGGVVSPILFTVYTDGLLKRIQETGVGCIWVPAIAEHLPMLMSRSGLPVLISECYKYGAEYDTGYGGSGSRFFFNILYGVNFGLELVWMF